MDREAAFLPILAEWLRRFPRLKVTLEHITTKAAVDFVTHYAEDGYAISATITPHHLLLDISYVIGPPMRPHHMCMPVAKTAADWYAVCRAAFSGRPFFRLGSDSAAHLKGAKECAECCAGVYTTPILLPLLYEIFEKAGALQHFEGFATTFGREWFALPTEPGEIELVREDNTIPAEYNGIVPFMAGRTLRYRLAA